MIPAHLHSPIRRACIAIVALALAAALALSASAGAAPIGQKVQAKRNQVSHDRAHEGVLTTTVTRYGRRIAGLRAQVAALRTREDRVRGELAAKQRELDAARVQLDAARARLDKLRAKLARSIQALERRLRLMYESGQPDVLTVVMDSNGYTDLLARSEYMKRIGDQDNRTISRVRDLKAASRETVQRLTTLELQIESARDTIAVKQRDLAQTRTTLESAESKLASQQRRKRSALASTRERRGKHEGELKILERQEAKIEAKLIGGGGAGPIGPVKPGSAGSGMIWPVNGPIASPFGTRWGRLHAGIDIAAPAGRPIRVAKSGTVALAAPTSGYGNYVCVNHGGSLSTCYAHMSKFATTQGAKVKQGQVIGYVGCTGHCFGDHLHFEVRINGQPTNPAGYL